MFRKLIPYVVLFFFFFGQGNILALSPWRDTSKPIRLNSNSSWVVEKISVKEPECRATVLSEIGILLKKRGDHARATQAFEATWNAIQKVPFADRFDFGEDFRLRMQIAVRLAKAGEREWAKKIIDMTIDFANSIPSKIWRRGRDGIGKDISNDIYYTSRSIIMEGLIEMGEVERVLTIAKTMDDHKLNVHPGKTLEKAGIQLAKKGYTDQAKTIAESLYFMFKIPVLRETAISLSRSKKKEEAEQLFSEVLNAVEAGRERSILSFAENRAKILSDIAADMAKAGFSDRALRTFETALETVTEVRGQPNQDLSSTRIKLSFDIMDQLVEAGFPDKAKTVLYGVLQEVNQKKDDPSLVSLAFSSLIVLLAKEGDPALEFIEMVFPLKRANLLLFVGDELLEKGDKSGAASVYLQAADMVKEPSETDARMLAKIAVGLDKAGEKEKAGALFDEAIAASKDPYLVAIDLKDAGRYEKALSLVEEIPYLKAETLFKMALAALNAGDEEKALDLFRQGFAVADQISHGKEKLYLWLFQQLLEADLLRDLQLSQLQQILTALGIPAVSSTQPTFASPVNIAI